MFDFNAKKLIIMLTLVFILSSTVLVMAEENNDEWEWFDVNYDYSDFVEISGSWDESLGDQFFDDAEKYSRESGAYVEITFTGSEFKWYGTQSRLGGLAEVYINDEKVETVDTFDTQAENQVLLFHKELDPDTYTIRIENIGERSQGSLGNYVTVDYLSFLTDEAIEEEEPEIKVAPPVDLTADEMKEEVRYRIPLTVDAGEENIPEGYTVSFEFNHELYVDDGYSVESGDDVSILYVNQEDEPEFQRLHRAVDLEYSEWNSADTKLLFKTQKAIPAGESDTYYVELAGDVLSDAEIDGLEVLNDRTGIFLFWDDFTAYDPNEEFPQGHWDILGGSWELRENYLDREVFLRAYDNRNNYVQFEVPLETNDIELTLRYMGERDIGSAVPTPRMAERSVEGYRFRLAGSSDTEFVRVTRHPGNDDLFTEPLDIEHRGNIWYTNVIRARNLESEDKTEVAVECQLRKWGGENLIEPQKVIDTHDSTVDNKYVAIYNNNVPVLIDFIQARKYMEPEPEVTLDTTIMTDEEFKQELDLEE